VKHKLQKKQYKTQHIIQPKPTNQSAMDPMNNLSNLKPPPKNGERHTLSPQQELRLEVPSHTSVALTLLSGSAEIFGAELATFTSDLTKQTYLIPGHAKFAVYTWHGCVLDVDLEFGKDLDICYTSEETVANVAYINTHAQLEAMRDEALMNATNGNNKSTDGPRVLIVGPADCGKTSLVKLLTSYGKKHMTLLTM
jgi:polyribonucleotide 5'-hydroxyl-kinase